MNAPSESHWPYYASFDCYAISSLFCLFVLAQYLLKCFDLLYSTVLFIHVEKCKNPNAIWYVLLFDLKENHIYDCNYYLIKHIKIHTLVILCNHMFFPVEKTKEFR